MKTTTKKMIRKGIASLLSACLFIMVLPVGAAAENDPVMTI